MIVITNSDLIEQVKRNYDDYRISHVIVRCGYDEKLPFIMEMRDSRDNAIKQINVKINIHIKSMGVVTVIKCEDDVQISLIGMFKEVRS